MSLLGSIGKVLDIGSRVFSGTVVGGSLASAGSLVGAVRGENIAKSLSKQVGCTIAQRNASQARALLAKGINPCTGLPQGGQQATTPTQAVRRVPTPQPIGRAPLTIGIDTTRDYYPPAPKPQRLATIDDFRGPTAAQMGYPVPSIDTLKIPTTGASTVSAYLPGSAAAISQIAAMAGRVAFTAAAKRKILRVVRAVGIQAAATILGMSLVDVAGVVANPPRRRRKGITGAQLANAKRVNRQIMCMAKELQTSCKTTPTRRKTSCR